jgi:hypothetical protein
VHARREKLRSSTNFPLIALLQQTSLRPPFGLFFPSLFAPPAMSIAHLLILLDIMIAFYELLMRIIVYRSTFARLFSRSPTSEFIRVLSILGRMEWKMLLGFMLKRRFSEILFPPL